MAVGAYVYLDEAGAWAGAHLQADVERREGITDTAQTEGTRACAPAEASLPARLRLVEATGEEVVGAAAYVYRDGTLVS